VRISPRIGGIHAAFRATATLRRRSNIAMIFRQLFDPQSSTYTYLLADPASREALLIDPVFEQVRRDAALVGELGCGSSRRSIRTCTPIT
jgi:glyoxylase-like metal-dependent hydrolase (beta-lactamase superfamily II)